MLKKQEDLYSYCHQSFNNFEVKPTREKVKIKKTWKRWSLDQNILYLKFIENNRTLFLNEFIRRSARVFLKLSKLLTRNPEQCRTHHQKIHKKCNGDISLIQKTLRSKIIKILQKKAVTNDSSAKLKLMMLRKSQENESHPLKIGLFEQTFWDKTFEIYKSFSDKQIEIFIDMEKIKIW